MNNLMVVSRAGLEPVQPTEPVQVIDFKVDQLD